MDITSGVTSVRGVGRSSNDDAYRLYLDQPHVRRAGRGSIAALARGSGPPTHARLAAWAVIDAIGSFWNVPNEGFTPGAGLRHALEEANAVLVNAAAGDAAFADCTVALSLLYISVGLRSGLALAIGDCPIYVVHNQEFSRLTRELTDQSDMSPSRIGLGLAPRSFHRSLKFASGDVFAMVSAGYRQAVPSQDFASVMASPAHPADVAQDMVDLAVARQSNLDSTAMVIRMGPAEARRDRDG
ncbi:MAG: hypothetical protein IV100_14120 [Myxococcales bacterium]|nr:hypothetical protein [Myxococcales bacterium]